MIYILIQYLLIMNWKEKSMKFKSGLILIGVSLIFFILLLIIPFLKMESGLKITLTTIAFILAEGLFYLGGFLLGKEIISKYKYWLNPKNWFKKKPENEDLKELI